MKIRVRVILSYIRNYPIVINAALSWNKRQAYIVYVFSVIEPGFLWSPEVAAFESSTFLVPWLTTNEDESLLIRLRLQNETIKLGLSGNNSYLL